MNSDVDFEAIRDIIIKAMRGNDTPSAIITQESVLRTHFGDEPVDEAIADGRIQPLEEDNEI